MKNTIVFVVFFSLLNFCNGQALVRNGGGNVSVATFGTYKGLKSITSDSIGLDLGALGSPIVITSTDKFAIYDPEGSVNASVRWDSIVEAMRDSVSATNNFYGNALMYDSDTLYALGIGQSGSLSADYNYTKIDSVKTAILSGSPFGGWITPAVSSGVGAWVDVTAPYGVTIGNSLTEGHPGLHGRLHPSGTSSFSPYYRDSIGQISYHLKELTGYRWYNHGIGGQTSTQVWARWQRDVLAQNYDPSDGRGGQTLPSGRKPYIVYVSVGANDVAANATSSTRSNMVLMANSANANGIKCIFQNIGANTAWTTAQVDTLRDINGWMASGILQATGAVVVDYNTWSQDPAYNDDKHVKPGNFSDNIHPSKVGYENFVADVISTANIPKLKKINLYTEISGPGAFARPTSATFDGNSFSFSSSDYWADANTATLDSSDVRITITAVTAVTGTNYSGIAHVNYVLGNSNLGTLYGTAQFGGEVSGTYDNINVLGGTLSGLTADYIPKASTSESLADSPIRVSGVNVGINASSAPVADLQLGSLGTLQVETSQFFIGHNTYFDGTNWKYLNSGAGGLFRLFASSNRGFSYYTIPTGATGGTATLTEKLRFNGFSGGLGLVGGIKVGGAVSDTTVTGVVDAVNGFRLNGGASTGNYLRGNGTNFVSSAIQSADIPNVFANGGNSFGSTANLGTNNSVGLNVETNNTRRFTVPAAGIAATTTATKALYLSANDSMQYTLTQQGSWNNTVTITSSTDTLLNSASGYGFLHRVGNVVTFTLRIEIALGSSGNANTVYISPPIASNFTTASVDVIGTASMDSQGMSSANTPHQRAMVFASTADDKIGISFDPVASLSYPENRMYLSVSGQYFIQ